MQHKVKLIVMSALLGIRGRTVAEPELFIHSGPGRGVVPV